LSCLENKSSFSMNSLTFFINIVQI
jgi:hypothetical protein